MRLSLTVSKPELRTHALTPVSAFAIWPEIEPLIDSALAEGFHEITSQDVLTFLRQGAMTALVTERDGKIELVCVAEIIDFPQYKVAQIVCLAGSNLREARKFLPALEAWALTLGAVEIRGWCPNEAVPRLYRRLGLPFTRAYTVIRYDLRGKLQ